MNSELILKKALPSDAAAIKELVNSHAESDWLIPRSLNQLYENIRDFFIIKPVSGSGVLGCSALRISWEDLAEIRSLVVSSELRGKGWGRELVSACLEEAGELGLKRVFTLTVRPDFFKKLGFAEVDKNELPQKIWRDCINCPHFPDCREVALITSIPTGQ